MKFCWLRNPRAVYFTHPVKEDVKEKLLSLPSRESKARDLHPAPASFLEGFLILPLLFTA